MGSRYVLLPYISYILVDKTAENEKEAEKIELTSIRISRNEEKQRFELALLSHKEIIKKFSVKDMTIQVQQYENEDNIHKFIIASQNRHKAEFFIECVLDKHDIEKIIQSMII